MEKKQFYIDEMCFFIPLKKLRNTPNVEFDLVSGVIERLSSIDRVKHNPGAFSPNIDGSDDWLWYMHPNQEDNLLVMEGKRLVELYTKEHDKVEKFEITPDYVKKGEDFVFEGKCVFGWPANVFHRVQSPEGSMSINFAKHFDGFDMNTNFNIYNLNIENGEHKVLREGHKDQGGE